LGMYSERTNETKKRKQRSKLRSRKRRNIKTTTTKQERFVQKVKISANKHLNEVGDCQNEWDWGIRWRLRRALWGKIGKGIGWRTSVGDRAKEMASLHWQPKLKRPLHALVLAVLAISRHAKPLGCLPRAGA
jgi:hypothetical protein